MNTGIPAVRLIGLAWLISIPNLVIAFALQGLSKGSVSMTLTMIRRAVLPIALVFILSFFGSPPLGWLAFAVAEAISIPLAVCLWQQTYRKIDF